MRLSRSIFIFGTSLLALFLLVAVLPAFGQGCALCYTQAAASGSRMIQALKSGILILIAPPTFMSVGLIFICYRKRKQTRNDHAPFDFDWSRESRDR
jgi:cbb3-type cytochrome oxidase subunit 3